MSSGNAALGLVASAILMALAVIVFIFGGNNNDPMPRVWSDEE